MGAVYDGKVDLTLALSPATIVALSKHRIYSSDRRCGRHEPVHTENQKTRECASGTPAIEWQPCTAKTTHRASSESPPPPSFTMHSSCNSCSNGNNGNNCNNCNSPNKSSNCCSSHRRIRSSSALTTTAGEDASPAGKITYDICARR